MTTFDRKFGKSYLASLPQAPGVYLIYSAEEKLIYVGKAKNLRRRLSQYRNAKRRKKHLKMRSIVKAADRIEIRQCGTELEACLLETQLIQAHRPKWNVAGAFYFLYPMVGMRMEGSALQFCFTTKPHDHSQFSFHGAFRSREISGEAFFSLMRLLKYVGHPTPSKAPRTKGSWIFAFRQLPSGWLELWARFWRGESKEALETLLLALTENAGARRKPGEIQEQLNSLTRFWKHEARPLAAARKAAAFAAYPVPQTERDLIFLKRRYGAENATPRHYDPADRSRAHSSETGTG
ncbi:MAG: nucleotide excision repair endonuclease [Bdellovibrionota bacterium]